MNAVARVGMSLLALGACAVAMRYTMTEVDVPEAKRQYHTWGRDLPTGTRALGVHYEATERESTVEIKAGRNGRIAGTYQGSAADRMEGVKVKPKPKQAGADLLSIIAGRTEYASYFLARPSLTGVADLRLPPKVSLEVNAYIGQGSRAQIDLRGLTLYSFCLCNIADARLDLKLIAPDRPFHERLHIFNDAGTTKLEIPRGAQGQVSLTVRDGHAQLYLHTALNALVSVAGDLPFNARDTADLQRRVNVRYKPFTLKAENIQPSISAAPRGYAFYDSDHLSQPNQVSINIELGSSGTLEIWGLE